MSLATAAFHIIFFLNLDNLKKHLLRLVEIELSVKFSPPFANTFSVMHNATSNRKTINQLTKSTNLTKKITKFEANNRYRKL